MESDLTTQLLHDKDEENYQWSRRGLAAYCQIPDDIAQLYAMANLSIGPKLRTMEDRVALTLAVPQNLKHLLLGTNSLYRHHSVQMYREVRSAVEAAGIAWLIRGDPAKYKIFVEDRRQDNASRTAAKEAFKPKAIFLASERMLVKLREHYDEASVRAHTTFLGFFAHLKQEQHLQSTRFLMHDIDPAIAERHLPVHLHWMCDAHLDIIKAVTRLIFKAEFDRSDIKFTKLWKSISKELKVLLELAATDR